MCFENEKFSKFCNLYSEIRDKNKDKYCCLFLNCYALYKSCTTVFRARCIVSSNKNNKEEYKYYFKGNKYKIKLNKNIHLTSKLIEAFDDNNQDITELIKLYAGPFEDFHNMKITPKMLNLKKIKLRILDEDIFEIIEKQFDEHDVIFI